MEASQGSRAPIKNEMRLQFIDKLITEREMENGYGEKQTDRKIEIKELDIEVVNTGDKIDLGHLIRAERLVDQGIEIGRLR